MTTIYQCSALQEYYCLCFLFSHFHLSVLFELFHYFFFNIIYSHCCLLWRCWDLRISVTMGCLSCNIKAFLALVTFLQFRKHVQQFYFSSTRQHAFLSGNSLVSFCSMCICLCSRGNVGREHRRVCTLSSANFFF